GRLAYDGPPPRSSAAPTSSRGATWARAAEPDRLGRGAHPDRRAAPATRRAEAAPRRLEARARGGPRRRVQRARRAGGWWRALRSGAPEDRMARWCASDVGAPPARAASDQETDRTRARDPSRAQPGPCSRRRRRWRESWPSPRNRAAYASA